LISCFHDLSVSWKDGPMSDDADDRLLTRPMVAQRYSVTTKTVQSWQDRPGLDFPQPLVIAGRTYWRTSQLAEWERQRATQAARDLHRAKWRQHQHRDPVEPDNESEAA